MAQLNLTLSGTDQLSGELEDVAEAAQGAKESLDQAAEKIEGIAADMKVAGEQSEKLADNLNEITGSASGASAAISKQERSTQDATVKTQGLNIVLDELTEAQAQAIGSSIGLSDSIDQVEEQMQETRNAVVGLASALGVESAAAGASVAPNNAAAQSMDEMGDEAAEARNKMAGAASMAELLSLQSSALSINVGAFTIALRNLTTQVPLLVGSLGNLAAAFLGVAGAVGAVGLGGFAVALGGAVAHAEEIAGPMASMEERLQAIQAIAEEFASMLREAIEPLTEMEGAVAAFKSLLEGLATTVRAFSQSIADSYANGPLRDAITALSDAWMSSIVAIGDSFQFMISHLESAGLFEFLADGIRAFDDFVVFVTHVVEDMMDIMGAVNKDNALSTFLVELMQLGRQVASGLAPLMSEFLNIIGLIAEELTALGSETIGAAVQVVALSLAFNRLLSMGGAVLQPLSLAVGHIGDIALHANSAGESFARMTGRMVNGLTQISGGFSRFATVMATAMPFMDPDVNNLSELGDELERTGGALSIFGQKFDNLISSFASGKGAITDIGSNFESVLPDAEEVVDEGPSRKGTIKIHGFEGIEHRIDKLKSRFKSLVPSVNTSVSGMASSLNRLPGNVVSAFSGIGDDIGGTMDSVVEKALSPIEMFAQGLFSGFDQLFKIPVIIDSAFTKAGEKLEGFFGGVLPAAVGKVKTAARDARDGFSKLRESVTLSEMTFTGFLSGIRTTATNIVTYLIPSQLYASDTAKELSKSIDDATESLREKASADVLAQERTEDFANQVKEAASVTDLQEGSLDDVNDELEELAANNKLAGMTTEQLSDEIQKLGFSSEFADVQVDALGEEMTETSLKAGVLSMANGTLASSFSVLTASLAAIGAILGGIVVIVGTAAAALMFLGQSGESAEGIISGLKETLMEVANTVMPFVVASGNMMIGVFNGIMAVVNSLISGFRDIGVALGFIDPEKANSGGMMAMLDQIVANIVPVINAVGLLAQGFGKVLAKSISTVINIIVQFLEAMHVAEIINIVSNTVRFLARSFGGLAGIMKFTLDVISALVSGIIKIGAIIGLLIGVVAAVNVVIAILNGQLSITTVLLGLISSPISLTAALILALIGVVVILLEKLGILDMILNAMMGTLSAIMDAFVGFAKVLGSAITGVIDMIVSMWNDNLAGLEIIPSIKIPGVPGTPFDGWSYDGFSLPELGGGGGGGGGGGDGSGGAGGGDEGDLMGGLDVLGGIGGQFAPPEMGGTAKGVNYNEGDTMNTYNQDISADPEDKAQMSRIAKDAMEEANSFARRQQGGQ